MSQRQTSEVESSRTREGSMTKGDDWATVTDPAERRKIQNKLAQRRYREKVRDQKEETERISDNKARASSSYTPADPGTIDNGKNLSGLPWGGVSMRHIMESGRSKEQQSRQSSRENSVYAAASRTGGSSRIGLHLTDQFARGRPAWRTFPWGHPGWAPR